MKKSSLLAVALTAAVVAVPFAQASADPVPGFYLNGGLLGNQTVDSNAHFAGNQNKVEYDLGYGGELSGGYELDNGIRFEGEVSYTRADVDKIKGGTTNHGLLVNTDVFGNVLYDFKTGTILTPYIGAGVGMSFANAQNMERLSNGSSMDDTQIVFAYQGIVGLAAQLTPHWALTADYRYIGTSDPRFATRGGTNPQNSTIDYGSHNIVVGVRYSFGKPMAPAPQQVQAPTVPAYAAPKPAVAPVPQSYMVFFDFNKTELTPEAQRILSSAAQDFRNGGYVRIVVTGHTDTVGSVGYNQKLSERRAEVVKAALEKLGVADTQIVANGVGKNGLLVPTADGVREAQNRRAEIVFDKQ